MFVTPKGNLLFAGAEAAKNDNVPARLFADDGEWSEVDTEDGILSTVRGGSAVIHLQVGLGIPPQARVMKSGGGSRGICAQVDGPPLATTAVVDLEQESSDPSNLAFVEAAPMHRRRHYHTLTILPDGTTLATAGNSCGNGSSGTETNACFANETTLEECEDGSPDCLAVTSIPCTVATDCPSWATCGNKSLLDCPMGETCTCNPLNNACYAVREAELWDPVSETWCLMAEQSFERMYHSTALLMPDGRVLSAGNGRRQGLEDHKNAEFFRPPYLLSNAPRPIVDTVNGIAPGSDLPQIQWGGDVSIVLDTTGPTFDDIGRVTLIRLGSVTHQNDMNQRFIDLGCMIPGDNNTEITVAAPANGNVAPPGHYMLLVLTESGTPSEGRYVHVGG